MVQTLGSVAVGELVKLNENGVPVEYLVVHQGKPSSLYDDSCDGTWLLRNAIVENKVWDGGGSNALPGADIFTIMSGYLKKYDADIQNSIKTVKIPYCVGGGSSTVKSGTNGLECKVFPLSGYEVGYTTSVSYLLPVDGTKLAYFETGLVFSANQKRIGKLFDNPSRYFLRSPVLNINGYVGIIVSTGDFGVESSGSSEGIRPAMVLPVNMIVQDDGIVTSQKPGTRLLSEVAKGELVKLNESGSPVEFYVACQDYESGLNGSGRTLLVRKDVHSSGQWNASSVNTYAGSTIDNWFNTTYKALLDSWAQKAIGTTKFYYTPGNNDNEVTTLERAVFAVSMTELGLSHPNANEEGSNLPISGVLKIAYFNNSPNAQYTRTPNKNGNTDVFASSGSGNVVYTNSSSKLMYRPSFTLPYNLVVLPDGTLSPGSTLTVPALIMQGNSLPVSWTAIDGADSYTLQRKADSGEWEQIYSGSDTSFTDTAGEWTTVQYQVQAVFDGVPGAWSQSPVVEVVSKSAVAISGSNGDLGTIISDIGYSVSTDTGKKISLTRTVNGVLVARLEVDGGFAYSIPVMDLPTGTGTIVITATVQTDSDPVTVTRTWTYTKAAQTFPPSGGVAQLQQDGQNVFPLTLAEAVKAIGGPWGGNLSTALDKLAMAAVYNRTSTPKYTEVKVDLSKVKAGDIVNLPENGAMVPFYVASLDYEPTLNTSGTRVLLVRKDVYQQGQWNSSNVNTYAGSTVDTWFNSTYKPMLDSKVLAEIGETTFYYTPGNGSNEVTTRARAVFALSMTEFGLSYTGINEEGTVLPIASTLLVSYFDGTSVAQFSRTPNTNNQRDAYGVSEVGAVSGFTSINYAYYRPCFTLPLTFTATYYVDQSGTVHADQEYTQSGSFADLWGNIIPTVKIETGSYVGTGTSGSSSPNMLTFQFEPKMLFIAANDDRTAYNATACIVCAAKNFTVMYPFNSASSWAGGHCSVNLSGNSVSWWMTAEYGSSDPQDIQFNRSGFTYHYVAIG